MGHWGRVVVIALAVLASAGCVNELVGAGREHEYGHDDFEMTSSSWDVLQGWSRQGEWLVSPVLEAPEGASRVGVLLGLVDAGEMPALEARLVDSGDVPGAWTPLTETWGEEDQHVAIAEFGVVGYGAQLRIRAEDAPAIDVLRWTAVIPEIPLEEPVADEELGVAREALRAELRGLGIVTRESWGARATRCTASDTRKTRFAIHHTVTGSSDPARQLRGIQRFHMDTRGWCDVGYHFLIGQDGRVYEGRPLHLLGAHVGGHNTGNIGVSFIGCFHSSGCGGLGPTRPTDASVQVAGRLLGTLSRLYGITLDSTRVRGHRDHSGQSTTCPGDHLRNRIGEMISIGRTSTLSGGASPSPGPSTGASCTHTYGGRYAHLACSPSYQCCNGSWRTRASGGCGTCICTETTGTRGCGL
jgi:hypothetical protein